MKLPLLRSVRFAIAAVACCGSWLASAADTAKPWPTAKPITWVVGYVPGGSVDVLTRAIAKVVSEKLGQNIVIENRPGASGTLALQHVSRAPGDGYTLVTVPGPILHAQRQAEIGRELTAIGLMSQGPIVMVGTAANAPANLKELIAAMKKNPDRWSFASSGIGTGQHLAGELFNSMAGTAMIHVPYKGGGQAVTDIVGGQVTLGMLGVAPVLPHIKAGQLKAYAVTTKFRIPSLPDVPTMDEAGLQGYDATQFFVAAAPRGVDPAILATLNATIAEALQTPDVKATLEASGQVGGKLSPAATQDFVVNALAKFNALVHDAKIKLN